MPKVIGSLLVAVVLLSGCAASTPPPRVNSVYLGAGTPTARPDTSQIYAFRRSDSPAPSRYAVVGEVEVTTARSDYGERELLSFAEAEALKLGGEAIIFDIVSRPTGDRSPEVPAGAGDQFVRGEESGHQVYATGSSGRSAGREKVLKATVIVWKRGE